MAICSRLTNRCIGRSLSTEVNDKSYAIGTMLFIFGIPKLWRTLNTHRDIL